MSQEFKIENMTKDLKQLIDECKNNDDLKHNPRNSLERIISKTPVLINGKKQSLSSMAYINSETINSKSILKISPFEKSFLRAIESALLEECNKGFGERIEKDTISITFYLPSLITQVHIDNIVKSYFRPIFDNFLQNKLKDIRTKYQDMIKPMQTKQRDMFNKYREQIDTESQKYTKQIQEFMTTLEKKHNIKI